jgi:hypothetical protein
MILLISPYQNTDECAAQVERATRVKVKTVNTLRLALAALRENDFSVVVADENLLESTPGSMESLMQRMQPSMPVIVDMVCHRPEKIAKLVTAALKRREVEFQMARRQALEELRSELKSDVTGLLLCSEIVMKTPNLPQPAVDRVGAVIEIAQRMKSLLAEKTEE